MKKDLDRREFLKVGAVGLGALWGAGTFGIPSSMAATPKVIRFGLRKEPQQLNPARDTDVHSSAPPDGARRKDTGDGFLYVASTRNHSSAGFFALFATFL